MIFKDVLQTALENTEGCFGVLIMGTDGIVVEKVWKPEVIEDNMDVALAEYISMARNADRTSHDTGLGKLYEVSLSGESGIFILRFIGYEYFIAMILSPDGNFGRGRFEMRRAELLLEKEFII